MVPTVCNVSGVRRIAIIGAGAGGLAAAKYLRAENHFSAIHVYEQRSTVGGLWNYCSAITGDGLLSIPQTSPNRGLEEPATQEDQDGCVFISPIYDSLEANIPRQMMQFSDLEFPSSLPLFPGHHQVFDYLRAYGEEVRHMIRINTRIIRVVLKSNQQADYAIPEPTEKWVVQSEQMATGETHSEEYDAVVVANGHYALPYVPPIHGLEAWNQHYPGSLTHSKYYRNPDFFRGKSVVVVGSNASGLDISSQIAAVSKLPVYLSQKSVSDIAAGFRANAKIHPKGRIIRVEPDTRKVIFQDEDIIEGVDTIVFCTGYFYSYPFLNMIQPHVTDDGNMVLGTFEHLFNRTYPTLSFLGLPQKVIPFPISEMQAAVVARVYSGRLPLPPFETMKAWEVETLAKCGSTDRFHTMGFPRDAEYMDMLVDWAGKAARKDGLENEGRGKSAGKWSLKMRWIREQIPHIRRAFSEMAENRLEVRTVEDLGFDFKEAKIGELHYSEYP